MTGSSRADNRRTATRERAAALRQAQLQAERRRRVLLASVAVVAVLGVIAALVVIKLTTGSKKTASGPSQAADAGVVQQVTTVPSSAFDAVGAGTLRTPPAALSTPALTADGKPRVLYVGAEYCPYCAAERWAVVAALSRFGTWSGLGQTSSASDDVYPDTATLSFHGATYTSKVISFTGVEQTDRAKQPLDTLAAADQKLLDTSDKGGGIPFIDLGGKYAVSGASYDPQVLASKTHAQIAAALHDPGSAIGKAVLGTADTLTAAICRSTAQQPSAVCGSAGVTAAAKALPAQSG